MEVQLNSFLTFVLVRANGELTSREKALGTHSVGDWVSPRGPTQLDPIGKDALEVWGLILHPKH